MRERSDLTRRRLLAGVGAIGVGATAAGAGTAALLEGTDWVTSSNRSDGSLGLARGTPSELDFSSTGIKPGQVGRGRTVLHPPAEDEESAESTGLSVSVTDVSGSEGVTAESETDTTSGGQLGRRLELALWIGTGSGNDVTFDDGTDYGLLSNGTVTRETAGDFEAVANYQGTTWSDLVTGDTDSVAFNVLWRFPDRGPTNNDTQGDVITIDIAFDLGGT